MSELCLLQNLLPSKEVRPPHEVVFALDVKAFEEQRATLWTIYVQIPPRTLKLAGEVDH